MSAETNQENKEKTVEILISMPTHAYFLSGIRDFTLNLIKNMTKFPEQWAYRFQSIVDELCNNAIEHGSIDGDKINIVFLNQPGEFMQISVEDFGKKKPRLNAQEIQELVNERRNDKSFNYMIRGRGLPKIVAEWTDELHFTDSKNGGIIVTVKKYLNKKDLSPSNNTIENIPHIMLN